MDRNKKEIKGKKIEKQKKKKNESLMAFPIVSPEGRVLALFPRYRRPCLVDLFAILQRRRPGTAGGQYRVMNVHTHSKSTIFEWETKKKTFLQGTTLVFSLANLRERHLPPMRPVFRRYVRIAASTISNPNEQIG